MKVLLAVGDRGGALVTVELRKELLWRGHEVYVVADSNGFGKEVFSDAVCVATQEEAIRVFNYYGIPDLLLAGSTTTAQVATNTLLSCSLVPCVMIQDASGTALTEGLSTADCLIVFTEGDRDVVVSSGKYSLEQIHVFGDPRLDRMILGKERHALRNQVRNALGIGERKFVPFFFPGAPKEAIMQTVDMLAQELNFFHRHKIVLGARLHPKFLGSFPEDAKQMLERLHVWPSCEILDDEKMREIAPRLSKEFWGDALSSAADVVCTVWGTDGERAAKAHEPVIFCMTSGAAKKERRGSGIRFPFHPMVENGCALGVYNDHDFSETLRSLLFVDPVRWMLRENQRRAFPRSTGDSAVRIVDFLEGLVRK